MTLDAQLFIDRFRDAPSLRRFLVTGADGDVFRRELPETTSLAGLAHAAVELVCRHGLVVEALLVRLPGPGLPVHAPAFEKNRGHDAAYDVRDHAGLARLVSGRPAHGVLWLLVAARRGGKTWTLKSLEHLLGEQARYFDLRRVAQWPPRGKATVLLLDEPQLRPGDGRDAAAFLDGCEALCLRGVSVVLALTPAELDVLRAFPRVDEKSVRYIAPLTNDEAARMAGRTEASRVLFDEIPRDWRRSAFILEWLLATHASGSYADVAALTYAVREFCELEKYLHFAFHDSFTAEQCRLVRSIARGEGRGDVVLREVGMVEVHDGVTRVADPVVAAAFTPVRIEHLTGPLDSLTRARLADDLRERHRKGSGPHLTICTLAEDGGATTEHPAFLRDTPRHIVVGADGGDEVLAYPDANVVVVVLSDAAERVPELPLAEAVKIAVLRSPTMCGRLIASTKLQRELYRAGVRLVLGPGAPDAQHMRLGWFEELEAALHLVRSPAESATPGSTRVEVRRDRDTALSESGQRLTVAVQRATFRDGAWTADRADVLE